MKILIIADSIDNQNAGIHTYTKNLITALLKTDHKNEYHFVHLQENPFFKDKNHTIIPDKKIPLYGTYRKFHLIPKTISQIKPDIVLEPCHIGPFKTPKNCKKITVIHDLSPITHSHLHPLRSVLIHKILLPKVIKNTNLIITPSQNTKNEIQKYFQTKTKIITTPLGSTITDEKSLAPKTVITKPYIFNLGTIEPRKNLITLIKAFKNLKKENQIPHQLVISGSSGWKNKAIHQAIKSHPDIKYLGFITEKEKKWLYENANIFVYPSILEGFGLPILDGLKSKIPTITANTSTNQELFPNATLTFNPSSSQDLEKQILKIITDQNLRESLIKNGASISKNFSWEKTAEKTIKALEKLELSDLAPHP